MSGNPTTYQVAAACGELLVLTIIGYYTLKFILGKLDPTSKQKAEAKKTAEKLMKCIGVEETDLNDYELVIAANLIDPMALPISWNNIGGLDEVVRDIKENVVLPFKNRELFTKSELLAPPKGMLLYGPPGCGKTMIAKATAKEAGCRFLNLDVASLTDKWYGESQKLANAVFSLASKIQPCIIFIDEIDSFLRSRSSTDHEATAMMKAQFMNLWDGLLSQRKSDVIIMGATNRPQDVDKAILRRMPCRFYIPMPNKEHRLDILKIILENEKMHDVDLNDLAELTAGCSGSDLRECCRLAALRCVSDASNEHSIKVMNSTGVISQEEMDRDLPEIRPISMKDFEESIKRMRNSQNLMTLHGLSEKY